MVYIVFIIVGIAILLGLAAAGLIVYRVRKNRRAASQELTNEQADEITSAWHILNP